jgi:hypothetical protein
VARKFMGMCILHADMRIPEDILEHVEERLRSRINSGGSESKVAQFNKAMSMELKLRHSIHKSADTQQCYAATLDGTQAKLLRKDWLLLIGHDLAACGRAGTYPSAYFQALHDALVDAGGCEDVLAELPLYAECARHYTLAMREARKMPADLRPDPEHAYVTFEEQSRLFVTRWQALGWTLKAYGFHLWANLPTLFRKWGSLEGISQQAVEGMIGKVARLMPHLQLKPCGQYKKEIRGNRALELEECERRRAHLDAPAEVLVEELMMQTMETTYGLTPKDRDAKPMREHLLDLDHAIATGNTTPADQYNTYWRRSMVAGRFQRLHAHVQVRRARRAAGGGADDWPSAFAALRAEVVDYYACARHTYTVSTLQTQHEQHVSMRARRKAAWREQARPSGRVGTALTFQSVPYFV